MISDTSENLENLSVDLDQDSETSMLTFAEIASHAQSTKLPVPIQNPPLLPLASLEPEVFERVVAELVKRQINLGAQFYGRRGQKQHGLDIVERRTDHEYCLYQVKRYETIGPRRLRDAVEQFAGSPRTANFEGAKRKFDPREFVVATSALFESDTGNVEELRTLQDEYAGDLEVSVWGAEALSLKLRDAPHLVYAVFGPAWAKAFCGYESSSKDLAQPNPLGLVEGPLAVLGLAAMEADAVAIEATDPAEAARLFGILARSLEEGNFSSNAAWLKRRQAAAILQAGDPGGSAEILFGLVLARFLSGEVLFPSQIHGLDSNLTGLDSVQVARQSVLASLARWYEHGSNLATVLPPLREIVDAQDSYGALLCCLTLEQALVDGIYDFEPRFSSMAHLDAGNNDLAAELRSLAASSDTSDLIIRARLRCAVADASLLASSNSETVGIAYDPLLADALSGRFLHARGLIASRAASAFAKSGDTVRAENLWRQSVLSSSEDQYYGDARNALHALRQQSIEDGIGGTADIDIAASTLPNRRRILAGSHESAFAAFEAAHREKLPEALGDARRYLWESRLSGHLQEELLAQELLGDVFAAAGHLDDAVQTYVIAGRSEKAAKLAAECSNLVDVTRWATSPLRRRRAAAIQVIGAQSSLVLDSDVEGAIQILLHNAEGLWTTSLISPTPELDAIRAIAKFGVRIPSFAIDAILEMSTPALSQSTSVSHEIANLLVQSYWSVEVRRADIANAIGTMLRLPNPPYNLWSLVQAMPALAREPLLPEIRAIAEGGNLLGVAALAKWGEPTSDVQLAARRACAALLREPIGVERGVITVGTQESSTVELLVALLDTNELVTIDIVELGPDKARLPGGVIYQSGPVPANSLPITSAETMKDDSTGAVSGERSMAQGDAEVVSPDEAALVAAGPSAQLASAVAEHFALVAEDPLSGAVPRVQAISALRHLLSRIPVSESLDIAHRLFTISQQPSFTERDRFEMGSTSLLSRFQMKTGGEDLPGYALLASAEAFQISMASEDEVTDASRSFCSNAVASAVMLLHDKRRNIQHLGALSCVALSKSAIEFSWIARCLIFHGDVLVRSWGVREMPIDIELFMALAADPSVEVRSAVASRSKELPESLRCLLRDDPHLSVRHIVAEQDSEEPEVNQVKKGI
jgi:hypothetical protein